MAEQMAVEKVDLRLAEAEIKALLADKDAEIARLQRQVEGHCERIAAASEVIARRAAKTLPPGTVPVDAADLGRLLVLAISLGRWQEGTVALLRKHLADVPRVELEHVLAAINRQRWEHALETVWTTLRDEVLDEFRRRSGRDVS